MTRIVAVMCLAALCGACGSKSTREWGGPNNAGGPGASGSAGATGVVAVSGAGGEVVAQVVAGSSGSESGGVAGSDQDGGSGTTASGGSQAGAPGTSPGSGGAGTSDGPGSGGEPEPVGAGGSEPLDTCECDSGACCDGCHYLGPETVCFFGSWSFCTPQPTPALCRGALVVDIAETIFCSGLSPLCVHLPDSLHDETNRCCPEGEGCEQHGEFEWVDPNDPPAELPRAECV